MTSWHDGNGTNYGAVTVAPTRNGALGADQIRRAPPGMDRRRDAEPLGRSALTNHRQRSCPRRRLWQHHGEVEAAVRGPISAKTSRATRARMPVPWRLLVRDLTAGNKWNGAQMDVLEYWHVEHHPPAAFHVNPAAARIRSTTELAERFEHRGRPFERPRPARATPGRGLPDQRHVHRTRWLHRADRNAPLDTRRVFGAAKSSTWTPLRPRLGPHPDRRREHHPPASSFPHLRSDYSRVFEVGRASVTLIRVANGPHQLKRDRGACEKRRLDGARTISAVQQRGVCDVPPGGSAASAEAHDLAKGVPEPPTPRGSTRTRGAAPHRARLGAR